MGLTSMLNMPALPQGPFRPPCNSSFSLCDDEYHNNVAQITANVLCRFRNPTPFPLPETKDAPT